MKQWNYETDGKISVPTTILVGSANDIAIKLELKRHAPPEGTTFSLDRSNGYVLSGRDDEGKYHYVDGRDTNIFISPEDTQQ